MTKIILYVPHWALDFKLVIGPKSWMIMIVSITLTGIMWKYVMYLYIQSSLRLIVRSAQSTLMIINYWCCYLSSHSWRSFIQTASQLKQTLFNTVYTLLSARLFCSRTVRLIQYILHCTPRIKRLLKVWRSCVPALIYERVALSNWFFENTISIQTDFGNGWCTLASIFTAAAVTAAASVAEFVKISRKWAAHTWPRGAPPGRCAHELKHPYYDCFMQSPVLALDNYMRRM
jgi:hypothetical protein